MIVFSSSVFSTVWSFLADLVYSLGALLVRQITGVPIKFAGASEKIDGLGRLMPSNIVALVEQVTANIEAPHCSWRCCTGARRQPHCQCGCLNARHDEEDARRRPDEKAWWYERHAR